MCKCSILTPLFLRSLELLLAPNLDLPSSFSVPTLYQDQEFLCQVLIQV